VVDFRLARVPRYEPDIGLTRLETVRASRAAVDQRRGPPDAPTCVCYRLWDERQTASFAAYTSPKSSARFFSSLVLDLAQWGVSDPPAWRFSIRASACAEGSAWPVARTRRARWRRPDHRGRKSLRALALPPRLARMIVDHNRWARDTPLPRLPPF